MKYFKEVITVVLLPPTTINTDRFLDQNNTTPVNISTSKCLLRSRASRISAPPAARGRPRTAWRMAADDTQGWGKIYFMAIYFNKIYMGQYIMVVIMAEYSIYYYIIREDVLAILWKYIP